MRVATATWSIARWKAASLARDGWWNPEIFLTNWSAAPSISSSVAGGSKLNRVRMFRHMTFPSDASQEWPPALNRSCIWCEGGSLDSVPGPFPMTSIRPARVLDRAEHPAFGCSVSRSGAAAGPERGMPPKDFNPQMSV